MSECAELNTSFEIAADGACDKAYSTQILAEYCFRRVSSPAVKAGVRCDLRDGVPSVRGGAPSYYLYRKGGRRMLVLSLGAGERMHISGGSEVLVLGVHDHFVKLGIICPAHASPAGAKKTG